MKTTTLKLTIFFIVMIFTPCSSDGEIIIGSGNLIEQQINLSNFDSIELTSSSSATINVTQSNTPSVVLTADDNIIDNISTEVKNNTLIIKYKYDNINYTNISTTLNIALPFINHIKVAGNSTFTVSNFTDVSNLTVQNTGSMDMFLTNTTNLTEFHLNNKGSLKFRANGTVQDFFISNSGNQKVYCFDFISNNCTISNSGSGETEIFCNDNLNITNSGCNDVFYKGYPNLTISSTSSGAVTSAN